MGKGIRRHSTAAGVAAIGLVGLSLLAPASAYADPAYGGVSAVEAAASYLAEQLAAGDDHLSSEFEGDSFPDHGVTIDAVLALDAAGVAQDQADASAEWIASNVNDYIGMGGQTYANAVAKTLYFAAERGVDPAAFGDVDLIALLASTEGTREPGRFSDVGGADDFSNNIGQSFAILGLDRADAEVSAAAVEYLRGQQCEDGGFQLAPTGADCASDPDATAMAAQALIAVAGADDDDVTEALDYLAGVQADDGSVGGGSTTEGANTNSAGLAAAAFTAGGRSAEAESAREYLSGLQHTCTSGSDDLTGVVSYDQAGYDAPEDADAGQATRATAQAVIGMAEESLVSMSAGGEAATPEISCENPAAADAEESTSMTWVLVAGGLVLVVVLGLLAARTRRSGSRS